MCTLQELAKGTTKKRKITRHVLRDGKPQPKEVRDAACCPTAGSCWHASPDWWQNSMHTKCISAATMVGPLPPVQAGVLGLHGCPNGDGKSQA